MSRSSRVSGVEGSPSPDPTPSPRVRTASPAGRTSSRKKSLAGDSSASQRTASPAGPVRRRTMQPRDATEEAAPRAASPVSQPFVDKSLLSRPHTSVAPVRAPITPSTPGYGLSTPYTPFTPASPGQAAFSQMRQAADAGKMQLGFHNDQYVEDISVEFLYKPHTVTALLVIVGVLLFFAFRMENSLDPTANLRVGVGAVAFFVLVLGLLVFPSGPFIRPHPLVWRLAFGVAVLYEMWLILVLFQTKSGARESMKFFDASLGVPVEERSYAAQCDLTWSNVKGNLDIFVVSHFIGWIVKALILRDQLLCWVISIQWELIEILFTHMLPNFAECWWDQWILDVGLSNALGIYIGCKLARYLEVKEYQWGSYSSIPSYLGKARRTLLQFTPASWTRVEWKSTSSLKRIFAVQVLILAMHLEELNAFMLKYILWVPPESKLNLIRLIIWAFVGVPSLRQIYSYISDPNCKRIGHQTFLCLVVLITELIVIWKFGRGEFQKDMPENVKIGFCVFMVVYALILVFLMLRAPRAPPSSTDGGKMLRENSVPLNSNNNRERVA